jgi:hypothetical protein
MSAVGLHRVPPRHPGFRRWAARVTGLLATAGLLGAGVAMVMMVMPTHRHARPVFEEPATAATKAPAKGAKAGRPALTRKQRKLRNAAVTVLRDQGYRPRNLAAYNPSQQLRVLIGRGDAGHRAFFFTTAGFLGTDTPDDSGDVRVLRTGRRTVTLRYRLYPGDRTAQVRFRIDDGKLSRDDSLPPAFERRAPG